MMSSGVTLLVVVVTFLAGAGHCDDVCVVDWRSKEVTCQGTGEAGMPRDCIPATVNGSHWYLGVGMACSCAASPSCACVGCYQNTSLGSMTDAMDGVHLVMDDGRPLRVICGPRGLVPNVTANNTGEWVLSVSEICGLDVSTTMYSTTEPGVTRKPKPEFTRHLNGADIAGVVIVSSTVVLVMLHFSCRGRCRRRQAYTVFDPEPEL